ncbi:DUF2982 domain-containing protein [Aliidiomarina sp. Khilg15.8]
MSTLMQRIRPHTKRNGGSYILLAIVLVIAMAFTHTQVVALPWPLRLSLLCFALITIALGVAKLFEPSTSLEISPQSIRYLHFKGSWELPWDDIVRFDIPTLQRGLRRQPIPFLGFRLRQYDSLLEQLSPRLAVHLLNDQRSLLATAIRSEKPAHRQYTDYFEVPDIFTSESGRVYRGVMATFAMRMVHMRELMGYDLLISQNAFDRPLEEFQEYLRQLQDTRQSHL